MARSNIRAVLYGTLRGNIWMPSVECTKEVEVDLTRERERLTPNRGGSLRYMIGSICRDGDFQSCNLTDDSVIEITCWTKRGNTVIRKARTFPITQFKDVQDYVTEAA